MERTNVWAKRANSRDTRDSGDMKSERMLGRWAKGKHAQATAADERG